MRGKWGADYLVPGYSGGESYLRRLIAVKGENREEREAHGEQIERALRMFAEPVIVLVALYIASGILHVGWLWYAMPVAMFLKQVWDWKFTRTRVQAAMTKKRKLMRYRVSPTAKKPGGRYASGEPVPVAHPAPDTLLRRPPYG